MAVVATLLESRAALLALRRSLPAGGPGVLVCRSPAGLRRVLESRLTDAVVLTPTQHLLADIASLRQGLPAIPVVAYAAFRPDDGELLLACRDQDVAAVAVAGVDDAVVGEIVVRCSLTAARRRALADGPRLLRLTEPLQQHAWDVLVREVERPIRTGSLAKRLEVSREHLSRQFGAGGAPNLKRVIDLARVACAAQLLRNPGYRIAHVVRLLHFASSSHLSGTTRRITGMPPSALGDLGPRGVLLAFARGKTRSRL
ncbi:MAG TPA: helix-turn-helix domain-containing protein [Gemmatimonadales bacterium]|nr:helix-turn-helix domain-containing protein [Gemmatimonadales bacterium]